MKLACFSKTDADKKEALLTVDRRSPGFSRQTWSWKVKRARACRQFINHRRFVILSDDHQTYSIYAGWLSASTVQGKSTLRASLLYSLFPTTTLTTPSGRRIPSFTHYQASLASSLDLLKSRLLPFPASDPYLPRRLSGRRRLFSIRFRRSRSLIRFDRKDRGCQVKGVRKSGVRASHAFRRSVRIASRRPIKSHACLIHPPPPPVPPISLSSWSIRCSSSFLVLRCNETSDEHG